ncbi:MAG TPA: LamG-like jellyroll fold domain-containing protein [Bacteroidia bacterium]
MKKTITTIAMALTVNAFAQVPSYVPTTGLAGWWSFTGNANDGSGNAHNGTVTGATLTTDRFGIANAAYSFNGTSSFISVPNVAQTGNAARSICAWINTNSTGWNCIIETGGTGASSGDFDLGMGYDPYGTGYPGKIGVMGFNDDFYPKTTVSVNNSLWHFIVATYDGAGNIKTFVDGIIDSSGTKTYNTTGQVNFIGKASHVGNENYFNGKIDDIGIWNRALTASEINGLYNGSICYQDVTVTDTLRINLNTTSFNPVTYQNQVKVYPNPTADHITINYGNYSTMTGYTLTITNTLGQVMFTTPVNTQTSYIALSTLGGAGVYFVNTINAQGHTIDIKKIVLQ